MMPIAAARTRRRKQLVEERTDAAPVAFTKTQHEHEGQQDCQRCTATTSHPKVIVIRPMAFNTENTKKLGRLPKRSLANPKQTYPVTEPS